MEKLGEEKIKSLHCHFSKIEFTDAGEKRHLTFEDRVFGPEFPPLAEVFAKYKMTPTVICESRGTQGADAVFMKKCFEGKINAK